ncbi:MAG: UPF0280 family protein [Chromatiales bacterium]|nr:UPF0280 family protein [Chromatiales bacterium]
MSTKSEMVRTKSETVSTKSKTVSQLASRTLSALRAGTGCVDIGHGASASWLSGERLFLQHGPINLIVRAEGESASVSIAYERLMHAFPHWLGELVKELDQLKTPIQGDPIGVHAIATRMVCAIAPMKDSFVTPMAAVAGAIADHAADLLFQGSGLSRVWVNNGGDIAFRLGAQQSMSIALVPTLQDATADANITIDADSCIRGVATSGWQGRSHSLGIADAVTVLATDAARADAAATLIANAVNADHPTIERSPALELDDMSDLGERMVTVAVGALPPDVINQALDDGASYAKRLVHRGVIDSATLCLGNTWRFASDSTSPLLSIGNAVGQP